jgi:hypothetical protein
MPSAARSLTILGIRRCRCLLPGAGEAVADVRYSDPFFDLDATAGEAAVRLRDGLTACLLVVEAGNLYYVYRNKRDLQ